MSNSHPWMTIDDNKKEIETGNNLTRLGGAPVSGTC